MLIGCAVIEPICLAELRAMVERGVVASAILLPQTGRFTVHVRAGRYEYVLASRGGRIRQFAAYADAVGVLGRIGLVPQSIDMPGYHSDEESSPCAAANGYRSSPIEASFDYGAWVRAEVSETLRQVDAGTMTMVPHEEAWARLRKEAEVLMAERDSRRHRVGCRGHANGSFFPCPISPSSGGMATTPSFFECFQPPGLSDPDA
jgi:hypothetical protein